MEGEEKVIESRKSKVFRWLKNHQNVILLIVIAVAFIIRLKVFLTTRDIPIWWDEGDYSYEAKRFGLDLGTRNLWYFRRTFLIPILFGDVFALGGSEASFRFLVMLMSLGVVAMTYLVGKELFNKNVGLIAAAGMAVSRIHLFLTGRVLNEVPATLFVLIGFYFFIKGYMQEKNRWFIYLAAIFISFGIMSRFATLLALIPIGVYILLKEKFRAFKNKDLWIFLIIILIILTPFLYLYKMHFPAGVSDFYKHYTGISAAEQGGGDDLMGIKGVWLMFMNLIPNMNFIYFLAFLFGAIMFVDIVLGYDMLFKNEKIRKSVFIFLWVIIPIIVHGMLSEYVQERYLSWSYPVFFMLAGVGFMKFYNALSKYSKKLVISGIVILMLVASFFLIGAANAVIDDKAESYLQVKQSGLWLKDNTQPWDIIVSQSRPQHAYYSERSVWSATHFKNEEEFNQHILKLKPKYFVISLYEATNPEWSLMYPQKYALNAEFAYFFDPDGKQPSIVIYRLDDNFYNKLENAARN